MERTNQNAAIGEGEEGNDQSEGSITWRLMTSGAISDSQLKVPPPAPETWRLTRSSTLEMTQTKEASTLIRLISQGSCGS